MRRLACVEHLAALVAAVRVNHPTRVAVDGVDGAGKTSLADELVAPLETKRRFVIRASVDGFHHPRADRYRRGADSAEGYYADSFDYPALRSDLLDPLGPTGNRRFRAAVFDHRSDRPVHEPHRVAPVDAILLFDGVFLQRPELVNAWDFRIWVEAPFDITVPRAVSRDAFGSESSESIRAKYERRYVPGQLIYMDRCRPAEVADVIFDNRDIDHPELRERLNGHLTQPNPRRAQNGAP